MSKITDIGAALDPQFERVSDTPRTDAHYKQILDDDLGLEYNETELRYWAEKLERELAKACKDSKRYRWLRERHENTVMDIYNSIPAMTSPKLLDAAIDAAMKESK